MEIVKSNPVVTALTGILTGVVCLGFVLLAEHLGMELPGYVKEGLMLGGMASLLGGVYGARHIPTAPAVPQLPPPADKDGGGA